MKHYPIELQSILSTPPTIAGWSYFCSSPFFEIKARGNQIQGNDERKDLAKNQNPLAELEALFNRHAKGRRHDPNGPPFQGGMVGYLSYEALHYVEHGQTVPFPRTDDVKAPWMHFLFFEAGVAFDEEKKQTHYFGPKEKNETVMAEFEAFQTKMKKSRQTTQVQGKTGPIHSNFTKKNYMAAIEQIQEKIKAGETFQANLSQRFCALTTKDPLDFFLRLNKLNPSPYAAYFESPELTIVSNSPELLFEIKGKKITTKPIKGTRPRGKNPIQDARVQMELEFSEKENAELTMIVDLERNDLGKICVAGSVKTHRPFVVEKYSHVQHRVGEVNGILRPECNAFDALQALFPGGSITGCPKVRTMRILREIEPVARGPYTGSLGWIGWNGDAAFNIMIRTAYFKKHDGRQKVFFHAGGGIIYDSNPEKEYVESLHKAEAIRMALQ